MAFYQIICVFIIILLIFPYINCIKQWKFTNIECVSYDKNFSDFKECRLKVVGRGVVSVELYVRLFQVPVTNISVNLSLFKKYSGYRPFLYNQTADFCQCMSHKVQSISFIGIFLKMFAEVSNANHPCPYNHDIIAHRFIMKEDHFRYFPVPGGEYKLQVKVGAYNLWRAQVNFYIFRSEN